MSPYYYRSCKMLLAIVILIAHNIHGSKTFSIPKVNSPNVSNIKEVDIAANDQLISGEIDAPAAESNNILKLTKPSKATDDKYGSNSNSTWFTLTTKVSIDNETSKEVITTADGILTVQPQTKGDDTTDDANGKNTVMDNIYTSSYSALSVTTGSAVKINDNSSETTTNTNGRLRPIDDVTIDDNEINTSKKELPRNDDIPVASALSDNKTKEAKSTIGNSNLEKITEKIEAETESSSEYNNQDNILLKVDESQTALETKNAKLIESNNIVAVSQMQSAEEFTNRNNTNEKDSLSVKPIGMKSSLYTVKPSYKRPKKLEITQPKPFMRDPNDNSWRNESISSLGIVFKANNATKPFTLVLKNKTDNELNAIMQKLEKDESNIPELKERLEKLSERRKSKKKRPGTEDKYYDEPVYPEISTVYAVPYDYDDAKQESPGNKGFASTESPKMVSFFDELESMFDEEKIMRTSMEIMKSTTSKPVEVIVTPSTPAQQYKPDRKPTVQYFPPREKQPPKSKIRIYNDRFGFDERLNSYTTTVATRDIFPISLPPIEPGIDNRNKYNYNQEPRNPTSDIKKDLYNVPAHDGGYPIPADRAPSNPPPYATKHFRDYDSVATKEFDRNTDKSAQEAIYANVRDPSVPYDVNYNNYYTNEGRPNVPVNGNVYYKEDLKYDNGFHPGRFSVSYPVLFNNSVIHNANLHGRVSASSSAFMKRVYDERLANVNGNNCDPDCDKLTLDLPPDYELHYYVPGQEETQEVEQKLPTLPPYPLLQIKHLQPIRFYGTDAL